MSHLDNLFSDSVEVLRYSQPSEPRMWGFLRFAMRCCCCCCCCCCLPAYFANCPIAADVLLWNTWCNFDLRPSFSRRILRADFFFNASGGRRTLFASCGGVSLIPYTTETQQLTVLSMYNNIALNNCNLFAHKCGDLWSHQLALKGARGVAPGQPGFKNIHLGFHILLPKVRSGTCSRAARVLR